METLIKKAIEGGYKDYTETSGSSTKKYHSDILLDPLFFQALSKACGWGEKYKVEGYRIPQISKCCGSEVEMDCNHLKCKKCQLFSWSTDFEQPYIYYALRFYEINLTSGLESAIAWLTNLVKE